MDKRSITTVPVALDDRAYRIAVGTGALDLLHRLVDASRPDKISIIADETVYGLHAAALDRALPDRTAVFIVPPGEASKSLQSARRIYDWLAEQHVGRKDLIVAFGGGMVGDLAGFVAATWMRGIQYVQVPTTLLAAIDASVGGKTAVNLPSAKNLVGVFHQPRGVFVEPEFLRTLPERELRAALAESIKHAAIRRPALLDWHESCARTVMDRNDAVLTELIANNCAIKAEVVAADERETGVRAILNYGHTIGHALEHLLEYESRHGECVGLGMLAENEIARGRGLLPPEDAEAIARLLATFGLPRHVPRPVEAAQIFDLCLLDKKSQNRNVHMVVLQGLGTPVRLTDVSAAEIARALRVIAA